MGGASGSVVDLAYLRESPSLSPCLRTHYLGRNCMQNLTIPSCTTGGIVMYLSSLQNSLNLNSKVVCNLLMVSTLVNYTLDQL